MAKALAALTVTAVLVCSAPMAVLSEDGKQCSARMTVTDDKASVTSYVWGPQVFSDLGCAVTWRDAQCAMDQQSFDGTAKGHDYVSGHEVQLPKAFFVMAPAAVNTPVGYGIATFEDEASARKFADEHNAAVMSYQDLLRLGLKPR